MEKQKKKTSIQRHQSSEILIPVQSSDGVTLKPVDDPDRPIAESSSARHGLGGYILATRANGQWNTEFEPKLLKHLLEENNVTIREAITAFKKAYSDHYTPASGVEWRHLWKYIEEMRMGKDRTYYTYKEMLNIVDKENITTDHFEFIERDKWKRK